jgi:phasin
MSVETVAFGGPQKERSLRKNVMNTTHRNPTSKSAGSPGNGAEVLRDAAETGSAQAEQAFKKVSAAAADAASLMRDTYSTAAVRTQEYNAKFIEFAQKNTKTAFAFAQQLASVKSPSEFFELSANETRKQFDVLTEQARELSALAQKIVSATAERVETDVRAQSGRS